MGPAQQVGGWGVSPQCPFPLFPVWGVGPSALLSGGAKVGLRGGTPQALGLRTSAELGRSPRAEGSPGFAAQAPMALHKEGKTTMCPAPLWAPS